MTGMYASSIGAHQHRSHRRDGYSLPPGVRVLTDWMRDAGYFTANLRGKKGLGGTGKTDWNFAYKGKPFDSQKWADLKSHQPFFAQINFPETHRGGAWNKAHRVIERKADPKKVDLPPYYPDHPAARKDWAQYLNAAMSLDKKVGAVLAKLEEDGLAENTVVIFFGDHGRAMVRGKQWCYDSGLHVPLLIRWPKGIPAPAAFRPGSVDQRLIAAIDITATTLAIAGKDKPNKMQGRVFLGPRKEPERDYVFGTRDRCDETVFHIRTVRDKRYRYIRNFMPERPFLQLNRYKERSYPMIKLMRRLFAEGKLTGPASQLFAKTRPKEELYDLERDPWEINNLAASERHAGQLRRLRAALDTWIQESGDQGQSPEDPKVIQYWEKTMRDRAQKRKRRPK